MFYVGILLTLASRLKQFFPRFYAKERTTIFFVNGVIIAAIFARIGVNIFSSIYQEEMDESYAAGDWFYPAY